MQKLIVLLHRREGMSTEEFHRYWREAHAPLLLRLPDLQRLVFNYGQVSWTGEQPAFDGISEDWFESEEAVQASFQSAARDERRSEVSRHERSRTLSNVGRHRVRNQCRRA